MSAVVLEGARRANPVAAVRALWRGLNEAQLFVGSFFLLIVLGTLALGLLPGLYTGDRLGWVDALFMAASAVCITGLSVVDTATYFTPAGQALILVLVQLGGLGMLTFTTLIIVALGRRLSLRQEAATGSVQEIVPHLDLPHLVRTIFAFTFLAEAIGAVVLYAAWAPRYGAVGAVWPAIFHAVSAFCNAGFSTFPDSLAGERLSPLPLFTVVALVLLGGIGFLTVEELRIQRAAARAGGRRYRLSLHSRLVLAVTAVLVVAGWLLFTALEWNRGFAELPAWAKALNGLSMSVVGRTAGFHTVPYDRTTDATNFLSVILMFIGGAPNSTAGGVKVTTFGVVGLLAWSRFRGRRVVSFWDRTIPEETVQRAVGLLVAAFGVTALAILALTITEIGVTGSGQGAFLAYMFEVTSAFNTTGTSMGVTAGLSTAGRLLVTLLMYVGRVGPLTFAAAIALRGHEPVGKFRYAGEDVVVG